MLKAINHQELDKIPIDMGGSISSTITVGAYNALKEYLGVKTETQGWKQLFNWLGWKKMFFNLGRGLNLEALSPRERVLFAIDKKETDRLPIDFGGRVSGIALSVYAEMKKILEVGAPLQTFSARLQTALVDEEILQLFRVDTRHIRPAPAVSWNPSREEDGSYRDEWGMKLVKPKCATKAQSCERNRCVIAACCKRDEGRPLGTAIQVEVSNHLKLLWTKAMVVSVKGKGEARFRQVSDKETNKTKPLLKCRKSCTISSKPGVLC